jgi:predicted CopG family antitoxin
MRVETNTMQNLQISDQVATQLHDMAEQEHVSSSELIERLIKKHSDELTKQRELKDFFRPFQKDMSGFSFDREDANAR